VEYVVNADTLAAIGGIMGALTGIISWLMRRLLKTKDEQIEDLKSQLGHVEATIGRDRDYYRDLSMRLMAERGFHPAVPPPDRDPAA
jgi:hypothetical protein